MCNRVGAEGSTVFCGDSIVVDPEGNVVAKANEEPQLLLADVDLPSTEKAWQRKTYLNLMRPEHYLATPTPVSET